MLKQIKVIRQKMLNPVLLKLEEMETRLTSQINIIAQQTIENTIPISKSILAQNSLKYDITIISQFPNRLSGSPFYWVTYREAVDPISIQARQGLIDIELLNLLALFPNSGTFLDVGANIGAFCLAFAANGWNGFAIEASSKNVNLLNKSIILNDFDIKVYEGAVYETSGKIYFVQNGPWGFIKNDIHNVSSYEEINCICLDDYENTVLNDLETLDLIKIDIEGSEVAAMRGMGKFLHKFNYPPIYMEMNALALFPQSETPLTFFQQATKLGYTPYAVIDNFLYEHNILDFPDKIYTDYLFLKQIPKHLKNSIRRMKAQNEANVTNFIIEKLNNYLLWLKSTGQEEDYLVEQHAVYLCYCLKDYPFYNNKPSIKEILSNIYGLRTKSVFIEKAISWFEHKDQ